MAHYLLTTESHGLVKVLFNGTKWLAQAGDVEYDMVGVGHINGIKIEGAEYEYFVNAAPEGFDRIAEAFRRQFLINQFLFLCFTPYFDQNSKEFNILSISPDPKVMNTRFLALKSRLVMVGKINNVHLMSNVHRIFVAGRQREILRMESTRQWIVRSNSGIVALLGFGTIIEQGDLKRKYIELAGVGEEGILEALQQKKFVGRQMITCPIEHYESMLRTMLELTDPQTADQKFLQDFLGSVKLSKPIEDQEDKVN